MASIQTSADASKSRSKATRTKPYKFPSPNDVKPRDPAVLCPGQRVLALYNQAHSSKPAAKIAKGVRAWFEKEASTKGWIGVRFLPEVQTGFSAGAILWPAPTVTIAVTKTTLVLVNSETRGDATD